MKKHLVVGVSAVLVGIAAIVVLVVLPALRGPDGKGDGNGANGTEEPAPAQKKWKIVDLMPPPSAGILKETRYPEPQTYNEETLFQAINGACEAFTACGYVQSARQYYRKGEGEFVNLHIFDMGTPQNAYAVFTYRVQQDLQLGGEEASFGDRAVQSPERIDFQWDRFHVQVERAGNKVTADDLTAVANAAVARIEERVTRSGAFRPPVIMEQHLPAEGLMPLSRVYFRSHPIMSNLIFISETTDVFGLDRPGGVEGAFAMYEVEDIEGGTVMLAVLSYPGESVAASARESFVSFARRSRWGRTTHAGVDFYRNEDDLEIAVVRDGALLRVVSSQTAGKPLRRFLRPPGSRPHRRAE